MAIEKDLLDQLLAGRDPKDVFNKDGLVDELKKALSERILNASDHEPGLQGLSEFLCVRRFPSCEHEALFEHNGELRLRLEPLARRPFPVRSRMIQDQI